MTWLRWLWEWKIVVGANGFVCWEFPAGAPGGADPHQKVVQTPRQKTVRLDLRSLDEVLYRQVLIPASVTRLS